MIETFTPDRKPQRQEEVQDLAEQARTLPFVKEIGTCEAN